MVYYPPRAPEKFVLVDGNGKPFFTDDNPANFKGMGGTGGGGTGGGSATKILNNTIYVDDFDGADDVEKIQNAIDFASVMENGMSHVQLQDRDYSVSSGILLKQNVLLSFGFNTNLMIDGNGTYNVIEMERNTAMNDPSFVVNTTGWDGTCVYLDGKHKYYNSWFRTFVRNLKVLNWAENHKGTGLHMLSQNSGDEISFLVFENPKFVGLKNAIKLESREPQSGVAYVTANRFTNLTIDDCVNNIDIIGEIYGELPTFESSSNQFTNVQIQLSPATESVVNIGSQFNQIDGMVWDDYHVPAGVKLIKFTNQSANNDLTQLYFQDIDRLEDLGTKNRTYHDVVDTGSDTMKNVFNPIVTNQERQMLGNQDDIFVNAHNEYVVNEISTNSNWYGNKNSLFTTEKDWVGWSDVTSANPVVIEIDMTAKGGISELDLLGCTFRPGLQYPKMVKIEVATSSGGAYSEVFSTINNESGEIKVNYYASKAWRVRYTFGDSEDLASTRRIRVSRIWGTSIAREGKGYVRTTNDSVVGGNIEFISGKGVVLKSPNGSRYQLKVDDTGALSTTKL